jgi:pyruvate/2-oxoacid:ferredoxin oxidoreductase alpha subunit
MLDLTRLAFELSFKYRNPVIVLADGYLGQMTGRVELPTSMVRPGLPSWAVWGDAAHRGNLMCSIELAESDLERHNQKLSAKFSYMASEEQRANLYPTEDAKVLVVACNTPARMAKGAVEQLRNENIPVGLFHPVTLWPFPIDRLRPLLYRATDLLIVEASDGQLEDEVRLALSRAGVPDFPIHSLNHMGGVLPQENEIVKRVLGIWEFRQ